MKKFIRNTRFSEVKVQDEIFMLDLEANKYYAFNSSAAYVLDTLYTPLSIDEIQSKILMRYCVDEEVVSITLNELLQRMIEKSIVLEFNEV